MVEHAKGLFGKEHRVKKESLNQQHLNDLYREKGSCVAHLTSLCSWNPFLSYNIGWREKKKICWSDSAWLITLFLGYRHLLQSCCGELCERMSAGEDLLIMHVFLLPREYATQLAEMEQGENIHPYPSAALISPKSSSNKKIIHAHVLDIFAHKNQFDFYPILAESDDRHRSNEYSVELS